MDQAFHVPWDKTSKVEHFCSRPQVNVIVCSTFEPIKGWNLKTRMIFTSHGLIDEKTNLNKNVATNKTYIRVKNDQNEDIEQDQDGINDGTATFPPNYEDEEDEPFVWD